ncbi:S-methyl-5'-thioadenosine phosphorylase [Rhodosalinus sp. FB01]|uniref:S-methyl-5'-thioadenosine phosphorylase n=1 Tax=Rhodosalinus sp. FB01 TaxID=3239194 RepID=UPI0035268B2B
MAERMVGVIGGSGLYEVEGLAQPHWRTVETPWGAPSDSVLTGRLDGVAMAFLPRHGRGHPLDPASVPYRANVAAMKMLGVTDLVSVSAVGSFREAMKPGDFVIVDQFIDRTKGRAQSFFGPGCVAHVSLAHPTCRRLMDAAEAAAAAAGATVHRGGTYLAMEGPQFSPLAESRLYREVWGADVIGMTNLPEARLVREAEICYASVAMVTDYDSWHPDHGEVEGTEILKTAAANAETARRMLAALPGLLGPHAPCPEGCDRALQHAIITARDARDPEMVGRLRPIAGRVLD